MANPKRRPPEERDTDLPLEDDLPLDDGLLDDDLVEGDVRYGLIADEGYPGPSSGGQSGDTQGLSDVDGATSESVRELMEEGQAFEAGIVSGIENAPDPDEGPLKPREVLADDVPEEYDERDLGDQR